MSDTKNISSMKQKQSQKINQLEEKLKRSMADYINLQKRTDSQRQLFTALASGSLVIKLLEVLDDLYLTRAHLQDPSLQMILDKFLKILQSEGLAEIKAKGSLFDPQTMDCVDTAPGRQDLVVRVQKNGYLLNGQVIRPAQVVVGTSKKIKT